jgi:hypothetical protein
MAVTAPADGRYRVYIVFDKQMAPAGVVGITVSVDGVTAGRDDEGGAGAQGDAPHPDYLWIDSVAAPRVLSAGPHTVTLTYAGNGTTDAKIDAILVQPVAESKVLADGRGGALAIYKSLAARTVKAQLPALAPPRTWMVQVYDREGTVVAVYPLHARPDWTTVVPVLAYGFTLAVGRQSAVTREHQARQDGAVVRDAVPGADARPARAPVAGMEDVVDAHEPHGHGDAKDDGARAARR